MFGIFKKTSWKLEGRSLEFFRQVFSKLPAEFHFLSDGLDKGLYVRFSVNHSMKEHFYYIVFDPSQSSKSMVKGMQFELENILIKQDGQIYSLNLTIDDGLWVGFQIQKSILDFNKFQVDISALTKSQGKMVAESKIENIVSGLICEQLDLSDLGEFEIYNNTYYQIKDLEDGNYIAIDERGRVFGLIHDSGKVELINESVHQFVDDVNTKKFDFEEYLNGKNGYT